MRAASVLAHRVTSANEDRDQADRSHAAYQVGAGCKPGDADHEAKGDEYVKHSLPASPVAFIVWGFRIVRLHGRASSASWLRSTRQASERVDLIAKPW
jgi:hypothetical protein